MTSLSALLKSAQIPACGAYATDLTAMWNKSVGVKGRANVQPMHAAFAIRGDDVVTYPRQRARGVGTHMGGQRVDHRVQFDSPTF